MAASHLFFAIACFFALHVNGLETVNGRIKITVQTTSGCGDTVDFIALQLTPTYALYNESLDIEFVPWGRASRDDNGVLICQFRERDCWANRLHRCALNLLKDNQDEQVEYMKCEFPYPRATPWGSSPWACPGFNQGSYYCANEAGLSLVDVDYCVNNPGDELDVADEKKGTELTEKINFIPSIVFNDEIDKEAHDEGFNRLKSLICFTLAADPTTGVNNCEV